MSSHSRLLILAAIFVAVPAMPLVSAPVSTDTTDTNVPRPAWFVPAQLSGRAPRYAATSPDRAFEHYGPQATQRAVRASLKVALVPDPLAMGSLIFCAFALRWIRMRRPQIPPRGQTITRPEGALPRAA